MAVFMETSCVVSDVSDDKKCRNDDKNSENSGDFPCFIHDDE